MWTYLPQLDGLRTVAVYLVLLYHAKVGALGGGFIGVDVFFVLSGFLVSNVILSEVDRSGTFRLGGFYARRVRRLLPAAVVAVIGTSVAFLLLTDVARRLVLVHDARSALLYYGNWHFLAQSTDYFASDLKPSPFLHFWSLAIEEQFYLFFPVLLLVLLRARARFARLAVSAVTLLLVASVISQLYWSSHEPNHAYYGTDARLYQLLAGALLAFALRARPQALGARAAAVVGLAGAAGIALTGSGLLAWSPTWRGLAATVASVALIAGLTGAPTGALARLLGRPAPAYLGKISYGTYLWHWPVILVIRLVLKTDPLVVAGLAAVIATALASLSYQVLELPIRTSPRLKRASWVLVATGISLSTVAALVVVPPILQSGRKPVLLAAKPAAATLTAIGNRPVPKGLDFAKLGVDAGRVTSCPADDPQACVVVRNPGKPVVLLAGDSYAEMLDPMFRQLAEDHGFTLAENIVPGCPWPEDLEHTGATLKQRAACGPRRDGWYEKAVKDLKPALVVLINHERDLEKKWARLMRARSGGDETIDELTYRTMAQTVQTISRYAEQVVMVQSFVVPYPQYPLECLAAARKIRDCAVPFPVVRPPSDGYMQALAAGSSKVSTVGMDGFICPTAPTCLTYRDGQVVWRDRLHLMTTFATSHREDFWDLLTKAGATSGLSR